MWVPVALKAGGVAALMLGLAGIGATSILNATEGVSVPAISSAAASAGVAWLAAAKAAIPRATPARISAAPRLALASSSAPAEPDALNGSDPGSNDGGAGKNRPPGVTPDGKVILNTANAKELTRLPGIGEKRAQLIVRLRERLKRFRRATDLLRVRGIGVKTLRRMLPHLVLDPPKPKAQQSAK